jgi:O-antigen/teichoic acid export membrane protein
MFLAARKEQLAKATRVGLAMHSKQRLAENIAALTIVQILSYAAPLITVPYLVRVLQPVHFGLVSFAQGLVLSFRVVTDYGFDFSATRAIAASRQNPDSIARIFWSTMSAKAILACGSALALALLIAFTPGLRDTPQIFAVSFLYVLGTALYPVWLFQGTQELKLAAAAFGAARLITIPAIFLLVHQPKDYVMAGGIQAGVELIASAIAMPVIWRRSKLTWRRPSLLDITRCFKQGWPLFLSGSALYLSQSSITVLLGFVAGAAQVGYYSAAEKLIRASITALNPISQALYPYITAVKADSQSQALRLIRKSFAVVGGLSLIVSVAVFCLARPIGSLVFGPAFAPSISILQWLAPLPLLAGLTGVFGTQTMLTFEMDSPMSRIMLACAALGLPLTLLLSWRLGATGAAIAAVAVALLIVLAMVLVLRRRGLSIWRHSASLPIAPARSA